MTGTPPAIAPPASDTSLRRSDGLLPLLHAEWIKLFTVRGWVGGLAAAAALTILLGLAPVQGGSGGCGSGQSTTGPVDPSGPSERAPAAGDGDHCRPPTGPDGGAVTDSPFLVHQSLRGDGTITARVTSLVGTGPDDVLVPWAKAGLIVKDGTDQGSSYAAVMVTGRHGVRFQHDYVHDTAGTEAGVDEGSPRWLRLSRSGDTIVAEESPDGESWTEVGRARPAHLPGVVEVGLFVASPPSTISEQRPFEVVENSGPSQATAQVDEVALEGGWADGSRGSSDGWEGSAIGDDPVMGPLTGLERDGSTFTLQGSGDVAPASAGPDRLEQRLVGTFVGLILVVAVSVLFVTSEYRRGLAATTFTATPRRGRVLAAKVVVAGAVAFALGLGCAGLAMALGGEPAVPVPGATIARALIGTGALVGLVAMLSVAVGTVARRHSAGAAGVVIGLVILPYMLATASVLPAGPSDVLLSVTPAAAFSVQQTVVEYHQVTGLYVPATGYFPLPPLAGLGVLAAYAAVAIAVASARLTRRDA